MLSSARLFQITLFTAVSLSIGGCVTPAPSSNRYQPLNDGCVSGNWLVDANPQGIENDLAENYARVIVSIRPANVPTKDKSRNLLEFLVLSQPGTEGAYAVEVSAELRDDGDSTTKPSGRRALSQTSGYCYHLKRGTYLVVGNALSFPFNEIRPVTGTTFVPVYDVFKVDVKPGEQFTMRQLQRPVLLPIGVEFSGQYNFKAPRHYVPDGPKTPVLVPDFDTLVKYLETRNADDWNQPIHLSAIKE